MNTLNDPVSVEQDLNKNRIIGANTPFLYVGSNGTSFAFHVEDYNLYNISYLHAGDPKTWYIISPKHAKKMERMAKKYLKFGCEDAVKHKILMPRPKALRKSGIDFGKIHTISEKFRRKNSLLLSLMVITRDLTMDLKMNIMKNKNIW